MELLKNKIALVTGAGSGIGNSVARLFARNGAKVVAADINEEGGAALAKKIKKLGGDAIFVRSDAGKPEDAEALVREAIQHYGRLDICCNNAGIGGESAPTGEYPLSEWQKVIDVNLNGVFYAMRYQIPAMIAGGGGVIVNIASILGQVGFSHACAYVAAKHGVVGLTRAAALEYSAQGIRINAVGPAFIETPLITQHMAEEAIQQLVELHPIGRLGKPEEVAELVLWLSAPVSSFVTGAYYPIDGGYLAK